MLELLVGDKYNLKPETLLMIMGKNGVMTSLEVMTEPFMPPPARQNAIKQEAERYIQEIESKVSKELEYERLFGVDNLETALRSVFLENPTLVPYNIFLYKEEGKEPNHIGGAPNQEFIDEARDAFDDLARAYKTCRDAYKDFGAHHLKRELEKKLRGLADLSNPLYNNKIVNYSLGYIGHKLGGVYQKIADDALSTIEKSDCLKKFKVDCSEVFTSLLTWEADLVRAYANNILSDIESKTRYIEAYSTKLERILKQKQEGSPQK